VEEGESDMTNYRFVSVIKLLGIIELILIVNACGFKGDRKIPAPLDNAISYPFSVQAPADQSRRSQPLKEILETLDSMRKPRNVDSQVFYALKKALKRELLLSYGSSLATQRVALSPPIGQGSKVNDLKVKNFTLEEVTLTFSYKNAGDYNEDGVVDISDIAPLAENFFRYTWEDPQIEVIDGDTDGQISISDVAVIAENFFRECKDYAVFGATDNPPTNWEEIPGAVVEMTQATKIAGWDKFEVTASINGYKFFRVAPRDSKGEVGEPSNSVHLEPVPPHILAFSPTSGQRGEQVQFVATVEGFPTPTVSWDFGGGAVPTSATGNPVTVTLQSAGYYPAKVTAENLLGTDERQFTLTVTPVPPEIASVTPTQGATNQPVTFVAEVSGDQPLNYHWNFGGGAEPNETTTSVPQVEVILGAPNIYSASLTAENADFPEFSDTFTFSLEVLAGVPPQIQDVQPRAGTEGQTVTFTATVIGDEPMTFSWDFGGGANPNSSTDRNPQVTLGSASHYNALLTVENPYGSDEFPFQLEVTQAGDGIYKVISNLGNDSPSLDIVDGNPAVAYQVKVDSNDWRVEYIRALDSTGSAWGTPVSPPYEPPAMLGSFVQLKVVGLPTPAPAIATSESFMIEGGNLLFSIASDSQGSSFKLYKNPYQFSIRPMPFSLMNVRPVIMEVMVPALAVAEVLPNNLLFITAIDEDGEQWNPPVTVIEGINLVSLRLSTVEAQLNPAICLSNASGLTYIRANDSLGNTWGNPLPLTSGEIKSSSMALIGGKPAIAFADAGMLKYIYATDERGEGWSRIISVEGEIAVDDGVISLAEVNGLPAIAFYDRAETGYRVKYVVAEDVNGGSWVHVNVAEPDRAKPVICLAEVAGRPAIVYGKWNSTELIYIRANDAMGTSWPSPR